MTQNPYAQMGRHAGPGGFGSDEFIMPAERRMSVLAVFSLILSLLCFIPGAGGLAIIFGGAAIVFISSSRGRLGGMGMAITGVLIGLFFSVLWILAAVGAAGLNQQFGKLLEPTGKTMIAIQADDWSGARNGFTPALNAAVTDERLAEFKAEYAAKVGAYQSMPNTLVEMVKAYMTVGQMMQGFQQSPTEPMWPMPANFATGPAIVIAVFSGNHTSAPPPGQAMPPLDNLGVMAPDGTEFWLVPRASKPGLPSPPAPSGDSTPEPSPNPNPDAPKPPDGNG